eukprot:CAMPEP_0202870258 /NCGR_PEP_ID=MMETSP1391-20130828/15131_1 /ASSEMBLY_ACC=CAM_ASM_000867 /TAXON_ID=1034604 /ORGANISM="Chlamydomonas leiostraca, Strain SAG 11-49" /LENGTH=323 /DNA_ID=CAMNT_0049550775 /DNA_START=16 /DNA_END=987 /DNA_ORIENTATION=-
MALLMMRRAPVSLSRPQQFSRLPRVLPVVRSIKADGEAAKATKTYKRAPSAFNLFTKAKYSQVTQELGVNGTKPQLAECSARLREMWEGMSDAEKAPYMKEAASVKEALEKSKAAAKEEKTVKKTKRSATPAVTAGPRPASPWARFLKSQFPKFKAENPDLAMTDITKLISAAWKSLSDEEKQKIEADYDKAMETYKTGGAAPAKVQSKVQVTPPARSVSPVQRRAASTEREPSPAPAARGRSTSPTAKAASPAPKAASPAPKAATPARSVSPAKATSPAPKAASPTRAASPTKAASPKAPSPSPGKGQSPARGSPSRGAPPQ